MQVPAAALEGASQGNAISTKMLKKANELQSQDLELVNSIQPKSANPPGMGVNVDVSA